MLKVGRLLIKVPTGQYTQEYCKQKSTVDPPLLLTLLWPLTFCTFPCSKAFLFLTRIGTFQPLPSASIIGSVRLPAQFDSHQYLPLQLPAGVLSNIFTTFEARPSATRRASEML